MAVTIFSIAVIEVSVRGELGEFSTGNFRSAVTGEPETTFDARHADLARGRRGRGGAGEGHPGGTRAGPPPRC